MTKVQSIKCKVVRKISTQLFSVLNFCIKKPEMDPGIMSIDICILPALRIVKVFEKITIWFQ